MKINQNFEFFNLKYSAKEWAYKIIEMNKTAVRIDEDKVRENFIENDYEINAEVMKLKKLLLR